MLDSSFLLTCQDYSKLLRKPSLMLQTQVFCQLHACSWLIRPDNDLPYIYVSCSVCFDTN